MNSSPLQSLDPSRTTWHITWGTYGTRLHGGAAATVDRQHNQYGAPFVPADADRQASAMRSMNFPPVEFTDAQRTYIEQQIPLICDRGGWTYRIAAAEINHVHVLCDIVRDVHGEKVRRLLKRWLGQALSKQWPLEKGQTWWAEQGSNKAVKDEKYLNNVYNYILRQRFTTQA